MKSSFSLLVALSGNKYYKFFQVYRSMPQQRFSYKSLPIYLCIPLLIKLFLQFSLSQAHSTFFFLFGQSETKNPLPKSKFPKFLKEFPLQTQFSEQLTGKL